MLSLKKSLCATLLIAAMLPAALAEEDGNVDRLSMVVGNTSVSIGDEDVASLVAEYILPKCDESGCDEGSPSTFEYTFPHRGRVGRGSAIITTSGFSYFNASTLEGALHLKTLATVIQTALNEGKECKTEQVRDCTGRRHCPKKDLEECRVPNFIKANLFGTLSWGNSKKREIFTLESKLKAQITVWIKSEEEGDDRDEFDGEGGRGNSGGWTCENNIDSINDGVRQGFQSQDSWALDKVACLANALDDF